jgi:hypothetical protein
MRKLGSKARVAAALGLFVAGAPGALAACGSDDAAPATPAAQDDGSAPPSARDASADVTADVTPTDTGATNDASDGDATNDASDGDAADGASDGDAADGATETGAAVDAEAGAPDGPPGPPVCGDGWRDDATEECDEADAGVLCSPQCGVLDVLGGGAMPDAGTTARTLANGLHAIAGDNGFAIVSTQTNGPDTALVMNAFAANGARYAGVQFSAGTAVSPLSDPVVVFA